MPDGGWIKLYRSIRTHWLWEDGNERYLKWWLDILMMVNHEDKKIPFDGKFKIIRRGEKQTSLIKLAGRWGINRRTVDRFLDLLISDGMISVKKSKTNGTTLKVLHYNNYQDNSEKSAQPNAQQNTQRSAHKQEPKELNTINYGEFIKWFNAQTGKNFHNTDTNKKIVRARLNEGFTKQDLVLVVKYKSMEWKDNPEMNKYLRFNTIFAPSHFNDYLNEASDYQKQHQQQSNTSKATDMNDLDKQQEENLRRAEEKYRKEHPELNE